MDKKKKKHPNTDSNPDIEFVLDYSGQLTEKDLDFLADLFARAILRRIEDSGGNEPVAGHQTNDDAVSQ